MVSILLHAMGSLNVDSISGVRLESVHHRLANVGPAAERAVLLLGPDSVRGNDSGEDEQVAL